MSSSYSRATVSSLPIHLLRPRRNEYFAIGHVLHVLFQAVNRFFQAQGALNFRLDALFDQQLLQPAGCLEESKAIAAAKPAGEVESRDGLIVEEEVDWVDVAARLFRQRAVYVDG